ncbi:glycosyltransferase family 4 protein [Paenibacillus sp. D51F]
MVINQLLPTISYGDAVSNSAINMMNTLNDMGIKSKIYAENIHPKMKKFAYDAHLCPKDESVIYHLSTGSHLAYKIPEFTKEKILFYHNITPANFFNGYSGIAEKLSFEGREQLEFLSTCVDYAFGASQYNCQELIQLGLKDSQVLPLIINYDDYNNQPNHRLLSELKHNKGNNILFVGRIAPNKKQEDIIKTFYYYNKYIDNDSKLYLIGSYQGMERYYEELKRLINDLNLTDDVLISGHIGFSDILSYYKAADLFLCMSEHEGFCVPIVEAMYFEIPIIAFESTAVTTTLGNGGFICKDKDHLAIAELMDIYLKDKAVKNRINKNQKKRLDDLSKDNTIKLFMDEIKKILKI